MPGTYLYRLTSALLGTVLCGAALLVAVPCALAQAPAGGTTVVIPGPGRTTKSADRPVGVSSSIPPGVLAARKVFLSNGGAEAGLFPHPFTGTQDRGYGYLHDALLASTRFEVVDSPASADLVLEIKLAAPSGSLGGDKKAGTEDALPLFTLILYDRPTHYILWTLSQTIDKANLQKTHDKNFDDALGLLMKQLITVAGAG